VECTPELIRSLKDEERVRVITHLIDERGLRARDLGVTINFISMVKSGKRRVSDALLCRALAHLTPEELARLLGNQPEPAKATYNDLLKVIATARVDEKYRELLFNMIAQYFPEYLASPVRRFVATEPDLEAFRDALIAHGLERDTINRHMLYLRHALAELRYIIDVDGVNKLVSRLLSEGKQAAARHTVKAIRMFAKLVIARRDRATASELLGSIRPLYDKPKPPPQLPTVDELRAIWRALPNPESQLYLTLLAECGLRPGEPFLIKVGNVNLDDGLIWIMHATRTKRSYFTFIRPEVAEWVKSTYLPRREWLLRFEEGKARPGNLGIEADLNEWRSRLLPFDRGRLRRVLEEAARRVIGRVIEPRVLRKFWATWMVNQGVPAVIVDLLQGRVPLNHRVLAQHYLALKPSDLRELTLSHTPRICCS
jgi:integrase